MGIGFVYQENPKGSSAPIEIPPPRPKRRPIHPYPKKSQQEQCPSPNYLVSDKEIRSPTSVLSNICCSNRQESRSNSLNSWTTDFLCISSHEEGVSSVTMAAKNLASTVRTWTRLHCLLCKVENYSKNCFFLTFRLKGWVVDKEKEKQLILQRLSSLAS